MAIIEFSQALNDALARHNARNQRDIENIDNALSSLGGATAEAWKHHQRKVQMDDFGGDENDEELNFAKSKYINDGDASFLNSWKQNQLAKAQMDYNKQIAENGRIEALNEKAKLDAEKNKEIAIKKLGLEAKIAEAEAEIADGKSENRIKNSSKTKLKNAIKEMKLEFPEYEYSGEFMDILENKKVTTEPKETPAEEKQEEVDPAEISYGKNDLWRDITLASEKGINLSEDEQKNILEKIETLFKNGELTNDEYSDYRKKVINIVPEAKDKLKKEEEENARRGLEAAQRGKSFDDLEEDKENREREKREAESTAENWISAYGNASAEEQKTAFEYVQDSKVKAILSKKGYPKK